MAYRTSKRVFAGAIAVAAAFVFSNAESRAAEPGELSKLSAEWWQLVNSIPPADNPTLDTDGAKCMIGQRGPVWFLAGTFFTAPDQNASRACDVPHGSSLFFPLANSLVFNSPGKFGNCDPSPSLSVHQVRQMATQGLGNVSGITVTLDGRRIEDDVVSRIKSKIFATALPADNIYNSICGGGPGTVPAGIYSPSADDGFYAFLPPLSVGRHHLTFSATSDAPPSPVTRTISYDLNVVPVR